MAENKNFQCSGDCLQCHANQRAYCASQFTYNSMRMIERMQETLASMQGTVEELKVKIDAIQNNEAYIFDPTKQSNESNELDQSSPTETTITQSGNGVE